MGSIELIFTLIIGLAITYFRKGGLWEFCLWSTIVWIVIVTYQGVYIYYTGRGNPFRSLLLKCCAWVKSIITGIRILFSKKRRETISHPKTLEEAMDAVIMALDSTLEHDRKYLMEAGSSHDFAAILHHSFGRFMRNRWQLWDNESALYKDINGRFGLTHGDDLSGIILQCTWDKIKGNRHQPQVYADSYKSYWAVVEAEKRHAESLRGPIGRGASEDEIEVSVEQLEKIAIGDNKK